MAVYTNDLRLTELATGEGSGTWGTTTNQSLSLIGEAFSFGTEAITTNADTHTTTIADGSTDPGRSLFLKYTGTLDSACTITIGPNTVSKLWFIENATSGSQNIIIKQGSGATVTIPNGQVKAIYSDGAGSGGAMVDAFQDLSVPDLFVDDDLTIGDDLVFSSDSAVITFGADGDTTLTHTDGSGLTLNSTNKIMFNDASQFIQGSSATVLALGATDEIDLTATAIDVNGTMDVSGALTGTTATLTTADNSTQLTLKSTDDDANAGPVFDMVRDSASPADSDVLGRIRFRADNDAGEETTMVYLQTYLHDASDGTEDGGLDLFARLAGTLTRRITINTSGEICFNEDSNDIDFRVESDGNANMLFVDAGNNSVGIGESNPNSYGTLAVTGTGAIGNFNASSGAATIQLYENGAGRFGITTPNGSAGANFTVAGSTKLTIDSSGNLGIATTSPDRALHIAGNPAMMLLEDTGGSTDDKRAQLQVDSGVFEINSRNDDNSARVDDIFTADLGTGNIGIGTSSPTQKLDLRGAIRFGTTIADVADGGRPLIYASDGSGAHTGHALVIQARDGAGSEIDFVTGTTPTTRMSVSDSEVSINDVSADTDFRVETDAESHGLFVDGGNSTVNVNYSLGAKEGSAGGIQMQIGRGSAGGTAAQIFFDGSTAGRGYVIGTVSNDYIIFNETSSGTFKERLSISDSEVVFNQEAQNVDFRVEGEGNANCLLVDASADAVMVGKSDSGDFNVAGMIIRATGEFIITRNGDVATFNRISTNGDLLRFRRDNSTVGSISVTTSATTYNTTSDRRLKTNIVDAPSASEDIDAIQVRSFDWKADGVHQKYGVIAQELESVAPSAVNHGDKEDDPMGVDYSKLVPMLIKEIQSLRNRVAELEGE